MSGIYCNHCGFYINQGMNFCPQCGKSVPQIITELSTKNTTPYQYGYTSQAQSSQPNQNFGQMPQYTQQMPPQDQYASLGYQPYYQYQTYEKPKVPGRSLGITSMVLGIIAVYLSFCLMVVLMFLTRITNYPSDVLMTITLFYAIFPILSLCFAFPSRKKGYINNISTSGLVLGTCSLIFHLISIIIIL